MEIETIKKSLIETCETGNINIFKPAFFSEKVKVCSQSKDNFLDFFEERLEHAHYKTEGNLYLKIRLPKGEDEFTEAYDFYSINHLYSRISVHIVESSEFIEIDVIPF